MRSRVSRLGSESTGSDKAQEIAVAGSVREIRAQAGAQFAPALTGAAEAALARLRMDVAQN